MAEDMKNLTSNNRAKSPIGIIITLVLFLVSILIFNLYISNSINKNEPAPIPVMAAGTVSKPAGQAQPPLPELAFEESTAPASVSLPASRPSPASQPPNKSIVREAPLSDVILMQ